MLEEFTKYYESLKKEEAIKFKYYHSLRVMNLSVEIGKSLDLNEEQLEIVKLIGLLHDFGRFEQWGKYNSFNDLTTFDHGDRAVELLFDENEIIKYHLDKKYYKIVYDAIKNHNKYEIGDVGTDSLIYCQIIRDADKLDILEQFTKAMFRDCTMNNSINKEIDGEFFKHMSIRNMKEKTFNDNLIIKIALIYDLNFDYSFKYIEDNKIIEKIEEQVDLKIFKKYIDEIRKYMEGKKC